MINDINGIHNMRRLVYYASKGMRAAYSKYEGKYKEAINEILEVLDKLYRDLYVEEASEDGS